MVLVPGQVQDDASVRFGSPSVKNDVELLRAVRRMRPDAYVVYKPHPDVLSGNRDGVVPDRSTGLWDERVLDVSVADCLSVVDEVHTMTSLVGFEALIRGIPVVAHGQPFYAGWGLTEDLCPVERRGRALALDELVAGVLLRYPHYYSWQGGSFCEAEALVQELAKDGRSAKTWSFRLPWIVRRARHIVALARDWTHV